MKPALLTLAAAMLLAGCGTTRTVYVRDHRPLIHDNTSRLEQVRANFAGKPAQTEDQGQGITCEYYGSPQAKIDSGALNVWVIRLCYRQATS